MIQGLQLTTRCKIISVVIIIVLSIQSQCVAQGFLKVRGKEIIDEGGKPIILRGMGLGGWMLQEGYMFRLANLGQQHRIRNAIQDVIGKEKADAFYNKWLDQHTTRADIDSMAAWGFNSIRLPMHYNLYTKPVEEEPEPGKNTWLPKGFAMTDSLLAWCKANKIYLILDLHAAPGGQGHDLPISDRDTSKPSLWQSEANLQKTIALWKKLAERYKEEAYIAAYDIINEPNWGFEDPTDKTGEREKKNEPLRKLMMDITAAIREVDKKHIIIIEGNRWGNSYAGVLPPWDDNMVLSFHKYGNYNNAKSINHFLELRNQYNIPIWLGEAGENSNTWFTEAIALMEEHQIGWAWWQLKKMGNNNPLEITMPDGYQKLLDYWSGKAEKPRAEEAEKILNELLENISIRKNLLHRDVIDAMFRQVNSNATLPYKAQSLDNHLVIAAVDFDYGRAGYAYSDRDTARYQWGSPPSPSAGNRGRIYRNDGVDITLDSVAAKPYIYFVEDGEWWQYTIQVKKGGQYKLELNVSSTSDTAKIAVSINNKLIVKNLSVPKGETPLAWKSVATNLVLPTGSTRLRILAQKGGFIFSSLTLMK